MKHPSSRCQGSNPIATESVLQSLIRSMKDSLGDFHGSARRLLSSFASRLSRGNITPRPWPGVCVPDTSVPICSRKAGYSAHSVTTRGRVAPQYRFSSCSVQKSRTTGEYASAQKQVSAEAGSGPPCHWRPPSPRRRNCYAFLQHPPHTGRMKQAPKVSQLCPLKDF